MNENKYFTAEINVRRRHIGKQKLSAKGYFYIA